MTLSKINQELNRVVGRSAVGVREIDTPETANRQVELETAEAIYTLPENELAMMLQELPDHINVLALREAIERRFPVSNPDGED